MICTLLTRGERLEEGLKGRLQSRLGWTGEWDGGAVSHQRQLCGFSGRATRRCDTLLRNCDGRRKGNGIWRSFILSTDVVLCLFGMLLVMYSFEGGNFPLLIFCWLR